MGLLDSGNESVANVVFNSSAYYCRAGNKELILNIDKMLGHLDRFDISGLYGVLDLVGRSDRPGPS